MSVFAACIVGTRCESGVSNSTGSAENLFTYSWFWWFRTI